MGKVTPLLPPVVGIVAPGYASHEIERRVLGQIGAEVRELDWGGNRQRLLELIGGVSVALVRDTPLDREAIQRLPRGGGIVRYGVGVDTIDLQAAREHGVRVANVPHYGADIEVADHAAALTLALLRRVVWRHQQVLAGAWDIGQREPIHRIADATLGLIGFGRIGRAYLQRMRGFGIGRVLVHDPHVDDATLVGAGVRRAGLDELFASSRIVALHAPSTSENRHVVNADALALMRSDACLVNTSRGALVDTDALAAALAGGRLLGAALDVQEVEPMAADNPLRALPNVILTDHMGWYSEATVAALQEGAAQAALEILTTGQPTHWANP